MGVWGMPSSRTALRSRRNGLRHLTPVTGMRGDRWSTDECQGDPEGQPVRRRAAGDAAQGAQDP